MRIVLLGAPGSGKGTQAKLLTEKFKIPQIATGDLLRQEVASRSELGSRAKAAMNAGELVSDQVVLGIIQSRLTKADARAGFVLDGFPRNIPQAQELDAMLARLGKPLQLAVLVDVDREVLTKRLTGRRGCTSCGAIYNIYFSPPRVPGKCDRCGSVLQHRSDDNEDAVRKRLEVYEAQSAPLVSYYKAQGKLRTVRGIGSVNDIFKNICDIIEVQIRPLAAAMSRAEAAAQAALLAARKSSKAASAASASAAKKAASKAAKKAASKKIATKKAKKAAKKVKKVAKKTAKKAKKKVAKKASRKTTKAQGKKAKKTK